MDALSKDLWKLIASFLDDCTKLALCRVCSRLRGLFLFDRSLLVTLELSLIGFWKKKLRRTRKWGNVVCQFKGMDTRQFVVDYLSLLFMPGFPSWPTATVMRKNGKTVILIRKAGEGEGRHCVTQRHFWSVQGYDVLVVTEPDPADLVVWCGPKHCHKVVDLRGTHQRSTLKKSPFGSHKEVRSKFISLRTYWWTNREDTRFPPFESDTLHFSFNLDDRKEEVATTLRDAIYSLSWTDIWILTRLCLAKSLVATWHRDLTLPGGLGTPLARRITRMWKTEVHGPFALATRTWTKDYALPNPIRTFLADAASEVRAFASFFWPATVIF